MNNSLPTIACGIVLIMSGQQAGSIGVFINTSED